MSGFIKTFNDIRISDLPLVGGKNASLGEMYSQLQGQGIRIPTGFAITAQAYYYFIDSNKLNSRLQELMQALDLQLFSNLRETGKSARELLLQATIPEDLRQQIIHAYRAISVPPDMPVAVRSSATAEDLPQASFAGQHDSFLNVRGETELISAVRRCFASLYTDRAIKYRVDKGFAHEKIGLSIGVQQMVDAANGCSGVAFTLEPESGFRDLVHISGVWGLGENLVQGTVTPDEFLVFKPTLRQGLKSVIQRKLGTKEKTMVYADGASDTDVRNIETTQEKRDRYVITEAEAMKIAGWCVVIEDHYGKPMDIEWAKDGATGEIYILQARPETVQSLRNPRVIREYVLEQRQEPAITGQAIGSKVATGTARILHSPAEASKLKKGDIVVTELTSPDWDPILKNSSAIITDKGGRTSHASIVARELGVPAVVGCGNATAMINDGETITVSCAGGKTGEIFKGAVPFRYNETDFSGVTKPESTEVMLIVGDPENAFRLSFYPNDGVGLMRIEFIITHSIGIHPMALVKFDSLPEEVKKQVDGITRNYESKPAFFIEKLAEGIGMIAAAFYPKDVIVRMSDFKTNEYAHLLGGAGFEPHEENPMLGFRGASRYYNDLYREGFLLECAAIRMLRREMGFTNIKVMIPFCRTVDEARKVIHVMETAGLDRSADPLLEIYMMAEIPSNVLLAEKFAAIFDGFSIGSNDLTQLTLGIDRDSAIISELFSEQDDAAKLMIGTVIEKANEAGIRIGLCGQAPSDYPEFAQFLVEKGISSVSFNSDALIKGIENIKIAEEKMKGKRENLKEQVSAR
ncbi:MAG TPA: phosphoenolpyruvate synthase [Chitinophagaceae bacterium]